MRVDHIVTRTPSPPNADAPKHALIGVCCPNPAHTQAQHLGIRGFCLERGLCFGRCPEQPPSRESLQLREALVADSFRILRESARRLPALRSFPESLAAKCAGPFGPNLEAPGHNEVHAPGPEVKGEGRAVKLG